MAHGADQIQGEKRKLAHAPCVRTKTTPIDWLDA